MEFAHVVPLGSRCQTTHNVHSFFKVKSGYPYDWYILPLAGLLLSLNEGMEAEAVYDPSIMKEVLDEDGQITRIKNQKYGLEHVHDFPRPTKFLGPDWQDHIATPKSRFAYGADKLRKLKDTASPILFIREYHISDDPTDLIRLVAALEHTVGSTPFHLLAVNYQDAPAGIENILVADAPAKGWRGDTAAWARGLASTGHILSTDASLRPEARKAAAG